MGVWWYRWMERAVKLCEGNKQNRTSSRIVGKKAIQEGVTRRDEKKTRN